MSEAGSRAAGNKAWFCVACAHRSRRCPGEMCVYTGHGNLLSRALVAAPCWSLRCFSMVVLARSAAVGSCQHPADHLPPTAEVTCRARSRARDSLRPSD